ncbi:integrase [Vibrio sp. E150_011]
MTKVVSFIPRDEWDASQALKAFIDLAKNELTVFGDDLDWDSNYWEAAGVKFGKLGERTAGRRQPRTPLSSPYLDFAKAYLRYDQAQNPTTNKKMQGVRALEAALVESNGVADLKDVTHTTFDDAQQKCVELLSKDTAAHAGYELQRLAVFLTQYKLTPSPLDWKTSLKKGSSKVRTGKKARETADKKMPNTDALDAMGEIFSKDLTYPRDILTSSIMAMLMCAPSRINEILNLPVDCEVEEPDADGVMQYGWRFRALKGGNDEIKWIPATMVEVAKKAVSRLKTLGKKARELAAFYESNDTDFYRFDGCPQVEQDAELTWEQAAKALGAVWSDDNANYRRNPETYCRNLMVQKGVDCSKPATLRSLRQFINEKQMPRGFPVHNDVWGINYSQALFCFFFYQFKANAATQPMRLGAPVSRQQFNHDIVSDAGNDHCIFTRHGSIGAAGQNIKLTSHQMRHLLNTMAQRGGLSQYDTARWSGRANIHQNNDYDHMDEWEFVGMLKSVGDGRLSLFGPDKEIAMKLPMTIQEFNSLVIPTAHITELGFCVLDWTMQPCQKFRDCINCTDHVCIKGDKRKVRMAEVYKETKKQLAQAEKAISDGAFGADRHYEHLVVSEARLRELLGIVNNPTIDDGAVVRLYNPQEYSPLKNATQARLNRPANKHEEEMLSDLMNLFGD